MASLADFTKHLAALIESKRHARYLRIFAGVQEINEKSYSAAEINERREKHDKNNKKRLARYDT